MPPALNERGLSARKNWAITLRTSGNLPIRNLFAGRGKEPQSPQAQKRDRLACAATNNTESQAGGGSSGTIPVIPDQKLHKSVPNVLASRNTTENN